MIPRMPEFLADLKRAGIQEFDALGHRADFHALRHTLCTGLGRVGVAPRAAMELMRHSDMRLTNMNHTDISQLPLLEALYKLPRWADSNPENTKPDSDKIVSQTGDVSGHFEAYSGTTDGRNINGDSTLSACKNGLKSHVSEGNGTSNKSSAGRIRTYNPPVNSRLLYH